MQSPSSAPWWRPIHARMAEEPLDALCAEHGLDPDVVLAAVAAADRPLQLSQAPWWPELQRRWAAGAPIRGLARLVAVEPRRLRRALARAGLRVGGQDLGPDGLPALRALRGRLGAMPDMAVARAAQVPVDAVIGERRRLGRPAFAQRRQRRLAGRLSPLRPGGAPLRPVRAPSPRSPLEPVVVRRPSRAAPLPITEVIAADSVLDARLGKLSPSRPAPGPPPRSTAASAAPRRIVRPPRPEKDERTADPATPSGLRRR